MTIPEAYELLDLPEGSDIQQVRTKFAEQYEEYRMQIDNAPTPNLRQRYEKNLALREEAFHLITGGNSLDDSQDLPSSALYPEINKVNSPHKPPINQAPMSLANAWALLGVQETSSSEQVYKAYQNQKNELEAGYQKARLENIKQAYQQELSALEEAKIIIDAFLQTNKPKTPPHSNISTPPFTPPINKNKVLFYSLIILVLFGIGIWFYFLKNEIPSENTFASQPETSTIKNDSSFAEFNALVQSADDYFDDKKYLQAKETYEKALALQPADTSVQHRVIRTQKELNLLIESKQEEARRLTNLKEDTKKRLQTTSPPDYSGKNWKKRYSEVSEIRDGMHLVVLKGKTGFTDENGKVIIPIIYERVDWFQNTLRVYANSEWFYIDKAGNRLDDDNHSY